MSYESNIQTGLAFINTFYNILIIGTFNNVPFISEPKMFLKLCCPPHPHLKLAYFIIKFKILLLNSPKNSAIHSIVQEGMLVLLDSKICAKRLIDIKNYNISSYLTNN